MHRFFLTVVTTLLSAALLSPAHASSVQFAFTGSETSGNVTLTYGAATDARYPQAYEITGISGTFSDSTLGLNNVLIQGLESLNRVSPEATNHLAPNDFSAFAVASGLPPENNGLLHYSNLFYPGGSPQTATDYPFFGGAFDIYGVLFDIGNNRIVNLWSNGVLPNSSGVTYGVAVVTSATTLDYVGNVTAVTPEPGTLCLVGTGITALLFRRRALRSRLGYGCLKIKQP